MVNPLVSAATFLISTLFGLYIILVLVRFILQYFKGDFYNPISQFIVKATSPALSPFRRFIPGLYGIDFAAIVLLLLLQGTETFLVGLIKSGGEISFNLTYLFVFFIVIVAKLLDQAVAIFSFSIIIYAIMSWFPQTGYNPAVVFIHSIANPVLSFVRRIFPLNLGGVDLSPLVALIGLQLINILLIDSIKYYMAGV